VQVASNSRLASRTEAGRRTRDSTCVDAAFGLANMGGGGVGSLPERGIEFAFGVTNEVEERVGCQEGGLRGLERVTNENGRGIGCQEGRDGVYSASSLRLASRWSPGSLLSGRKAMVESPTLCRVHFGARKRSGGQQGERRVHAASASHVQYRKGHLLGPARHFIVNLAVEK